MTYPDRHQHLLSTVVILCLSACTKPVGEAHFVPVQVVRHEVRPSATAGPGEVISDRFDDTYQAHVLTLPVVAPPSGELFVFLPGTGAQTSSFDWIAQFAAFHGTPTLTLAYDNTLSIEAACNDGVVAGCRRDDVACDESARREALYGRSTHDSACIDVPDHDAIVHRTLRAVQWLAEAFPEDGFERFLDEEGTALQWSRIGVGGWSQGGGHSGLLAGDHELARAVYLSKGAGAVLCGELPPAQQAQWGCDPSLTTATATQPEQADALAVPAPWTSEPRATPSDRQRGAVHLQELAMLYSLETFVAFGMIRSERDTVDIASVDDPSDPAGPLATGQVYVTGARPSCGPTDFHPSMATDECLALLRHGVPVLADAYSWMFAPHP